MVSVEKFGKMVQVSVKGISDVEDGASIAQLGDIPKSYTMVSMPYYSTDSGKIRHCQVEVNEEGKVIVSNIDEVNENLNGSLCFIKA